MLAEVGDLAVPRMTREQAIAEASRCLMCYKAPCEEACPAGVGATTFIRRIRFGDFAAALRKIVEANVLAGTCGMTCPKGMQCEDACVLRAVGRPIQIRDLQLAAHLYGFGDLPQPGLRAGAARAAVVGGGPAGLACAHYLKTLGLSAVIFDRVDRLGGMLTRGIPEYRVARDVADREIGFVTDGLAVVAPAAGEDLNLANLRKQGFGAVFLATGLWESSIPRMDGSELKGVYEGSALLADLAAGKAVLPAKGSRVAVVGGGNTACDIALSLKRHGDCDVTVFYRRTREEMPAFAHEINDALIDGVKFEHLVLPVAIQGKGKVSGLRLVRTRLGEPDASGRKRPVVIEGSEFEVPCDSVVFAAGGRIDAAWLERAFGLEPGASGRIPVSSETLATSVAGVFAGGDLVRDKGLVVEAVSDGRRAAFSIAKYLGEQR
jgi:NADPH-dependent glutamate synthase beta subunit-like oxidoreductase